YCGHLLLAARGVAGLRLPALLQPRKIAIDLLEVTAQIGAAARVSAREEIFLDGEMLEAVPALHHLDHSALDELRRVEPVDPLAPEFDVPLRDFAALGTEKVRDRLQRRRLAGAIRAEQGNDL